MNIEGYKEYWVRITDMTALLRCASFGLASVRVPVVKVRDYGNDDRLIVVGSVFREFSFNRELFLLRRHTKVLSLEEALEFNIRDEARKTNLCIDCIVSDIPQALKISDRVSKAQVLKSPLYVSESSSCVSGSGAEPGKLTGEFCNSGRTDTDACSEEDSDKHEEMGTSGSGETETGDSREGEGCTMDECAKEGFTRPDNYHGSFVASVDLGATREMRQKNVGSDIARYIKGAEEEIASRDMKIVEDYWSDQINSLKNNPAFAEGKQMLPDEIDLYNFFEKWGGRASCVFGDFRFTPEGPRYDYNCRSLQFYLSLYSNCSQIKYYIGLNRYYSIKFEDRGVFLVSEKRYNELKAKKGK